MNQRKRGRKKLVMADKLKELERRKHLKEILDEIGLSRKIELEDITGSKEGLNYRSFRGYSRDRLKTLFKILERIFKKGGKWVIFRLDINGLIYEKRDMRNLVKGEWELTVEEMNGLIKRLNNNKRHNRFLRNIEEIISVVEKGPISGKSHGHYLFIVNTNDWFKDIKRMSYVQGNGWVKEFIERMKLVIYRMLDKEGYRGKDRVRIWDVMWDGGKLYVDSDNLLDTNGVYVWGSYLCKERKDKNGERFFTATRKLKKENKDLDNYDCITL